MYWFFKDLCEADDAKAERLRLKAGVFIDEETQDYSIMYNDTLAYWDKNISYGDFGLNIKDEVIQVTPFKSGIVRAGNKVIAKDLCYIIPLIDRNSDKSTVNHKIYGFLLIDLEQYKKWANGNTFRVTTLFNGIIIDNSNYKTVRDKVNVLMADKEIHEAEIEISTYLVNNYGAHGKTEIKFNWSEAILKMDGKRFYTVIGQDHSVNGFMTNIARG